MADLPRTHLLSLPAEIREEIYRLILHPDANRCYHEDEYTSYNYADALAVFRINRQIYLESRKIFRDLNVFVRVETPWPEAQQHVALEGHVPIIVTKDKAARFSDHSMTVCIDAPDHMPDWDTQKFVVLLDDLDKFTRMWYYADLTHPGLNSHLRLKLNLRDPFTPEWEEKRIAKAIQRRLLLPFGEVKNLYGTIIGGDVQRYGTLEKELREIQAKPHMTPEHCLREAVRLKNEGNAALLKGRYQEALQLFVDAWGAMHIVIKGRRRIIHADAFFGRELQEAPFKGKNGQQERLVLRIHLVASTCEAYLKLGDYEACRFWGMRSIMMLRQNMGGEDDDDNTIAPEDEAVPGFPAAGHLGEIYKRTAAALKALGEEKEAWKLLRVARIYFPNDANLKKDIEQLELHLALDWYA